MAERRMFAKTIIDSDAFLDMPVTARLLYYDLSMRADDDGFVNSPKKIMRMIGASQDDLQILAVRKFIIPFENGVVVIKHWLIHNYIRKDTYNETPYKEEKALLELDENSAYRLTVNEPSTSRRRVVDEPSKDRQLSVDLPSTQDRLGKDRIGKDNKVKGEGSHRFAPPSLEEVKSYCQERNNGINPEAFIDFYASKGWRVGNQPMKDWKAAVRTWEKRDDRPGASPARPAKKNSFQNMPEDRESANESWSGLQPFHAGPVEDLPFYEEPELVDEDEEWRQKVANSAAARRWGA